jgi:hypothetical protein
MSGMISLFAVWDGCVCLKLEMHPFMVIRLELAEVAL